MRRVLFFEPFFVAHAHIEGSIGIYIKSRLPLTLSETVFAIALVRIRGVLEVARAEKGFHRLIAGVHSNCKRMDLFEFDAFDTAAAAVNELDRLSVVRQYGIPVVAGSDAHGALRQCGQRTHYRQNNN